MWPYQYMTHYIHLLQRRRKYDDYGDVSEAWANMGRTWAKIIPKSSMTLHPTYEVTIRHPRFKIDHIEWGSKVYRIVGGITEDVRQTWKRFLIAPL
jgi:head-tail adaptor